MSILIKGMRMPENCCVCPFAERIPPGRTRCLLTCRMLAENYEAPRSEREEHCPLVDLGEHGRLIDADDLKNHICAWAINGRPLYRICKYDDLLELLNAIDNVQTVIEAEDKE